jgi:hypothetical protein
MQGPADVPHQIADAHLPEAASVFDAATALDTAMDMVDPQPTLVERLVRHVLLSREFLPQIGINLIDETACGSRKTTLVRHNRHALVRQPPQQRVRSAHEFNSELQQTLVGSLTPDQRQSHRTAVYRCHG